MAKTSKAACFSSGILLGLFSGATISNPLPNPLTFTRPTLVEGPNGRSASGIDINNSGTVAGQFERIQENGNLIFRAFLWSQSMGFVELLSGNEDSSSANAINDCNEIAGEATMDSPSATRAVVWRGGNDAEDLGTLPGGTQSGAFAINERGSVAGGSGVATPHIGHAFLWTPANGMRDLGTCPGFDSSIARAMNNRDEVVGICLRANSELPGHAFFWSAATGMIDLGTHGFDDSDAFAVSDAGEVVGVVGSGFGARAKAFRWTLTGGMKLLGDFGNAIAVAQGINQSGHMVGDAIVDSGERRATFWSPNKAAVAIDAITGRSSSASAINDRGQIVGYVQNGGGQATLSLATWKIRNFKPRGRDITAAAKLCQSR